MNLQKTLSLFALLMLASSVAQAGFALLGGVPAPCGKGGKTFESATRNATFRVFLTDCNGGRIGNTPFTSVTGNNLLIDVPGTFNNVSVGDVPNITNLSHSPGEASDLRLESPVLDPTTNLPVFEGLYARIEAEVGAEIQGLIPDLYGDTNGDGKPGLSGRQWRQRSAS